MNLPPSITAALDALEACYPSYSAFAAKARAEVERLIHDALSPATASSGSRDVLRLVSGSGARGGGR